MNGRKNHGLLYSAPMGLWLTVFFAAPFVIVAAYSFMEKDTYGGVTGRFALDAWQALANPKLLELAARTLLVSLVATAITLAIALPVGYRIARSKRQQQLLLLVVIPFWTNFLLRVFAWMVLLGSNGPVNGALQWLGVIEQPLRMLKTQGAVILVLVYVYLPYAILPVFSAIDKFDFALLEAARDLGASKWQAVRKVLLPNVRAGVFTAFLFSFIPIFGSFVIQELVGDKESAALGNRINDLLMKDRNLPLTSSISLLMTLLTTGGILAMLRMDARRAKARAMEGRIAEPDAAEAPGDREGPRTVAKGGG
jgi:spermidine/putrescine transport system permease protein